MGQMIDYVSQFEVDESYEQINYQETPYRVTPLEYSDLIKWVTNRKEGLPIPTQINNPKEIATNTLDTWSIVPSKIACSIANKTSKKIK